MKHTPTTQLVYVGGVQHTVQFTRIHDETMFHSVKVGNVEVLNHYEHLYTMTDGGFVPLLTMLADKLESPSEH